MTTERIQSLDDLGFVWEWEKKKKIVITIKYGLIFFINAFNLSSTHSIGWN